MSAPRTRALARRQAVHDAKVLDRIRRANLAKFRDEAGRTLLPAAKGSGWTLIGETDTGGAVHLAPVGTPPPMAGQGSPAGVSHEWAEPKTIVSPPAPPVADGLFTTTDDAEPSASSAPSAAAGTPAPERDA